MENKIEQLLSHTFFINNTKHRWLAPKSWFKEYEEGLDDKILNESVKAIQNADVLVVAGTSLTVQPASGLIRFYNGNKLILINKDSTPYDMIANLVINDRLGKVFKTI